MPKGDLSAAAVIARINASAQSLVINFPPTRPVAQVIGPAALPASPLTGIAPAATLVPVSTTPSLPALTLKCLWLDAPLSERPTEALTSAANGVGWVDGALALARVVWEDAQADLTNPAEGTWFDKALNVEFRGLTWRVLKTEPVGASFRAPHSLSVWFVGADKN